MRARCCGPIFSAFIGVAPGSDALLRSDAAGVRDEQAGQKVGVVVPIDASIEGLASSAGLAFPTVEAVESGSTVTVWTSPAKVTLAAQAGEKGALSAARVVVRK